MTAYELIPEVDGRLGVWTTDRKHGVIEAAPSGGFRRPSSPDGTSWGDIDELARLIIRGIAR